MSTTITSVLPVLAILVVGAGILGATGLEDFGVALFIGLLVGTYSSIFVASQVLVWWREREPAAMDLRDRVAARNPGVAIDMVWPDLNPSATRAIAARPRRGSSGRPLPLADRPAPETVRPVLVASPPPAAFDDDPLPAGIEVDDGAGPISLAKADAEPDAAPDAGPDAEVDEGADPPVGQERTARPAGLAPKAARPRGRKRR